MSDSADAQDDFVLAERRGRVLVLTFNRPDRNNAWGDALEAAYFARLLEADEDPAVGAIVVTGAGRSFCPGADISDLQTLDAAKGQDILAARTMARTFPLTVRKPMIAAINGAAAGIGLLEALYCDIRFTTPAAKLTTAFAHRGLPAEYGMSWILPRLMGTSRALDLLLSSRIVQGPEAEALGLVNRVVAAEELLEEAVAYADQIATLGSPWSLATIKSQVMRDFDGDLESAQQRSEALIIEALARPDVHEGVAAYVEKREPRFAALGARP